MKKFQAMNSSGFFPHPTSVSLASKLIRWEFSCTLPPQLCPQVWGSLVKSFRKLFCCATRECRICRAGQFSSCREQIISIDKFVSGTTWVSRSSGVLPRQIPLPRRSKAAYWKARLECPCWLFSCEVSSGIFRSGCTLASSPPVNAPDAIINFS